MGQWLSCVLARTSAVTSPRHLSPSPSYPLLYYSHMLLVTLAITACLSLILIFPLQSTLDLIFFSPPGHNPLSPEQTPFKVILTTPTAGKLTDFLQWVQFSYLKSFLPSSQDNPPPYISTPTGPCSLKFQMIPRTTSLPLVSEE